MLYQVICYARILSFFRQRYDTELNTIRHINRKQYHENRYIYVK